MPHESTIKVYRSSTVGSIPNGLTDGELAANLADGKIFVGNGNEVINFESNPHNNVGASGSGIELVSAYAGSIHLSVPKRTNLILYSHDFVSSGFPNSWSSFSGNGSPPYPTITNLDNDSTQGWQGSATGGFQIEFINPADSNNGVYQEIRTPHLVTGEYYTLSCWARSNSGETKFRFSDYNYITNISRFSDKFIATTDPQRFHYVFRPEARTNISISNGDANSSGTIRVWGIQLERGTFPSSPIRSDGTETTASASIISFASSSASSVAGVTGFNSLTGNVSLTGHTGGAVRVVENNKVDIRIATSSVTGVAAFNSTYYSVSAAGVVSPTTPFQFTGDTVSTVSGSGITVTKNSSGAVVSNIGVTGIGFSNTDVGLTGKINLTAGTDISLIRSGNTITINYTGTPSSGGDTVSAGDSIQVVRSGTNVTLNNAGVTGIAFGNTDPGLTGRIVLTGNAASGIILSKPTNSNIITLVNIGVTGFNGLTGNVSLTGYVSGAVRVVENNKVDIRIATSSVTGVAAFNSTYYSVSAAGVVSPTTPFQTTGDTVRANWPIKQTITGKRVILDIDQPTCWDPFNVYPDTNGYYYPGNSLGTVSSTERPGATFGLSGASPGFWYKHFLLAKSADAYNPDISTDETVNRTDYCLFLRTTSGPGGLLQTPFGASGSGIGTTGTTSGILKYFYLDINNLETATNTLSSNDNILIYDAAETGEIKTKKASVSKFFLDNDTIFTSLSPDQLKRNTKSSAIEFEVVLGDVSSNSLGLINGASAHSYITKNTVKSINGCTGQITITGTVNEVVVTNNCPTIVIGLPDNVMVPYISISGGTFTETVSANLFIGSIAGGTF